MPSSWRSGSRSATSSTDHLPVSAADLRNLPSVERLVSQFELQDGPGRYPRPLLVDCARAVVEETRARLLRAEAVDTDPHAL
ncbi:MAG: hypothetical protein E6G98_08850, partial [Bacillati bacterium ANGP1]